MKAIHNNPAVTFPKQWGAFTEQNYKNWKQFTTFGHIWKWTDGVLLLNKITKIESNSQLVASMSTPSLRCFYWTKLQKLKAIHNTEMLADKLSAGAFTEQNYKNWKQFTTYDGLSDDDIMVLLLNKITKIESNSQHTIQPTSSRLRCFYWTKLQKLKAIHNILQEQRN